MYLCKMSRVHQITDEIKEFRNEATHKAALRVYNLLENNKKLFIEKIDKDTFEFLTKSFRELSEASAATYNSPGFKRDYSKSFEGLMFHLQKII
jgi:hypothetical protein